MLRYFYLFNLKFKGTFTYFIMVIGGSRVVRRGWVNFQCRGVLLTWITVGQGPIVLAVGAPGGCLDIFSLIYHFSFLSPSLMEMAGYTLKHCLKGPLSPKQPTNHHGNKLYKAKLPQVLTISNCKKACLKEA